MAARKRAMTWSAFDRIYRPLAEEPVEYYDIPKETEVHHIWTLVDVGDACHIVPGIHYVNRLGYFVTGMPWIDGDDIWVLW